MVAACTVVVAETMVTRIWIWDVFGSQVDRTSDGRDVSEKGTGTHICLQVWARARGGTIPEMRRLVGVAGIAAGDTGGSVS